MLTREEAKEFLPIIQAFAEGKTIQVQENEGYWQDVDVLHFNYDTCRYRIKPELKYRPFKSAEECWKEMQKHQPFGWVKAKAGEYRLIDRVTSEIHLADQGKSYSAFCGALENYTFADGETFGVKEE